MSEAKVFDDIYRQSTWGFMSGPGSDPANAQPWIDTVNEMLAKPDIHTVLDIGCGDWRLGQQYNLTGKKYFGVDVSEEVLKHTRQYATEDITFMQANAADADFYGADLILIKDVLQHLPNSTVKIIMDKIVANGRYALICNDIGTGNGDIHAGGHRGLNLQDEPFNYPVTNLKFYGAQIKMINFFKGNE